MSSKSLLSAAAAANPDDVYTSLLPKASASTTTMQTCGLPNPVWGFIFSCLPLVQRRRLASHVCKQWYHVSRSAGANKIVDIRIGKWATRPDERALIMKHIAIPWFAVEKIRFVGDLYSHGKEFFSTWIAIMRVDDVNYHHCPRLTRLEFGGGVSWDQLLHLLKSKLPGLHRAPPPLPGAPARSAVSVPSNDCFPNLQHLVAPLDDSPSCGAVCELFQTRWSISSSVCIATINRDPVSECGQCKKRTWRVQSCNEVNYWCSVESVSPSDVNLCTPCLERLHDRCKA